MIKTQSNIESIKANLDKPIVLVGLMGAGKTTVGRILADMLGWPFFDSDDEIVRAAGKSISAIFEEEGEPAFRDLERITIRGLLRNRRCVIATGGGSISVPETASMILEGSVCLWLDASVPVLVERTKGSDRPLLKHGDPAEVLGMLLEKRRSTYMQAHLHILDDNLDPDDMASRILMQICEYLFDHNSIEDVEKHVPQALCLTVSLFDRSYPIFIGANLLHDIDVWLSHEFHGRKAFIITDYNVRAAVTDKFQAAITPHMKSVAVMELPPGEQTKSFDRFQVVVEWMIENGIKRDSIVFAVGGGVIGDLTGFASSAVLRGVEFIQVPTTLLSMVDSSVGGKTGINSKFGKNMIGAFYQPRAVVIDMEVLSTLPAREWLAGYAEIVKTALLGDSDFFTWLEINANKILEKNPVTVMRAIEKSCHMKAEIVAQDEHEENGMRAKLNLGHTFGHAFENLCGYGSTLLHGEAVGVGLVLAARLSHALGHLSEKDVMRITYHLSKMGLKTEIRDIGLPAGTTVDQIIDLMRKDKKSTQNGMVFVVLTRIGDVELVYDVPEEMVEKIIRESM
ncbi:MAG: 3-dehydroquinate synthase [Alphaproteobacteria bacterium RIFCSPHIGHO2_02_FULL_46_13]|nr:MAG: 3-dehydroquinate synthase [Alphaproteobacteria bacterium RIFCSPHIGHO2_02_FULL_46_13]